MTKTIVGVGLLLFADNMSLCVVEELRDKPEISKKRGMLSFPLETMEEVDATYEDTLWRLAKEEMGLTSLDIRLLGIHSQAFHLIPGRPDIETRYGYGLFHGDANQSIVVSRDEAVRFAGWMKLNDLLLHQKTRVETAPIIESFIRSGHYCRLQSALFD